MSYCLNPACTNPNNLPQDEVCQTCGNNLIMNLRYRASRVLGRGGFATTFLAVDQSLPGNPTCVIKQLRPVLTAPHILEMSRELFQREASTLGKVGNHPQLPRLLDYFEADKEFYLIQEYVAGSTLQQQVRRTGPFDEEQVKAMLVEVLPTLGYLHKQRVIHRDIKPSNIICRELDNKLVLIDFGAVKDQVSQVAMNNHDDQAEFTSFAVGTPGFAPPEQMAMRPIYASDVYSLGVTCLYLLTGKSPKDLNYNSTTGELDWRSFIQVSPGFTQLLEKMMAISVRDRFSGTEEVEAALAELKASQSKGSPMPTGRTRAAVGVNSVSSPNPTLGMPRLQQQASPTSRIAARIREQQQRLGGDSDMGMTRVRQNNGFHPRPGGRSHNAARPKVLNAEQFKKVYGRGERDFASFDLRNIQLPRCQLKDVNFQEAQMGSANFQGGQLIDVKMGRTNLSGACLAKARLINAYMSFADLEGADLRGADLSFAYLSNANLRGANLCGANLTGATVTDQQLSLARINRSTVMPNGRKRKRFGLL
ncbi:MAG: serine/threonine-protein kinase [Cyanobacteria bacterium P01_F01_bin.42]